MATEIVLITIVAMVASFLLGRALGHEEGRLAQAQALLARLRGGK